MDGAVIIGNYITIVFKIDYSREMQLINFDNHAAVIKLAKENSLLC
jgi:hypothetical protein